MCGTERAEILKLKARLRGNSGVRRYGKRTNCVFSLVAQPILQNPHIFFFFAQQNIERAKNKNGRRAANTVAVIVCWILCPAGLEYMPYIYIYTYAPTIHSGGKRAVCATAGRRTRGPKVNINVKRQLTRNSYPLSEKLLYYF